MGTHWPRQKLYQKPWKSSELQFPRAPRNSSNSSRSRSSFNFLDFAFFALVHLSSQSLKALVCLLSDAHDASSYNSISTMRSRSSSSIFGWFESQVAKQGFASQGLGNLFGGPKKVLRSWNGFPQAEPQEQCLPHLRPYLLQAQDVQAFFLPLPFLQAHLVSEDFDVSSLVCLFRLGAGFVVETGLGFTYVKAVISLNHAVWKQALHTSLRSASSAVSPCASSSLSSWSSSPGCSGL